MNFGNVQVPRDVCTLIVNQLDGVSIGRFRGVCNASRNIVDRMTGVWVKVFNQDFGCEMPPEIPRDKWKEFYVQQHVVTENLRIGYLHEVPVKSLLIQHFVNYRYSVNVNHLSNQFSITDRFTGKIFSKNNYWGQTTMHIDNNLVIFYTVEQALEVWDLCLDQLLHKIPFIMRPCFYDNSKYCSDYNGGYTVVLNDIFFMLTDGGSINAFDLKKGEWLYSLYEVGHEFRSINKSDNYLIAMNVVETVNIYHPQSGKCVKSIFNESIFFSVVNNQLFVSQREAGKSSSIVCYDLNNFQILNEFISKVDIAVFKIVNYSQLMFRINIYVNRETELQFRNINTGKELGSINVSYFFDNSIYKHLGFFHSFEKTFEVYDLRTLQKIMELNEIDKFYFDGKFLQVTKGFQNPIVYDLSIKKLCGQLSP